MSRDVSDDVLDTWTGKVYYSNGELVEYTVMPCCEGAPMDSNTGPIEPLPEIQPVVPLPTDGLGVPESQIPERNQTSEIRRKIPGEF